MGASSGSGPTTAPIVCACSVTSSRISCSHSGQTPTRSCRACLSSSLPRSSRQRPVAHPTRTPQGAASDPRGCRAHAVRQGKADTRAARGRGGVRGVPVARRDAQVFRAPGPGLRARRAPAREVAGDVLARGRKPEALDVEGEVEAVVSAGETFRVWWERREEVERLLDELGAMRRRAAVQDDPRPTHSLGGRSSMPSPSPSRIQQRSDPREPQRHREEFGRPQRTYCVRCGSTTSCMTTAATTLRQTSSTPRARSSLTRPRLPSDTQSPGFALICKEVGTHPRRVPSSRIGRQCTQVLGGNA